MRVFISKIVAAAIWLTACGTYDPREGASIEAPFLPYVKTFEDECGCEVRDLPITFGEMESPEHIGECQNYRVVFDSYSEVLIDQTWWEEASDNGRERLIMHELGHCVLRRPHNKSTDGRFPISLMFPTITATPDYWYKFRREKYLDELFQRGEYVPFKNRIQYRQNKPG